MSTADLVARTGVPLATIHYYRRLGLLPPVEGGSPRRLHYGERHVQAILLVRRLRQRQLPLQAIAAILPDLMAAEEEAFRPEMWDKALSDRGAQPASEVRLVSAATDAFIRHGYAEVAVGDVSSAAGLAKGTVYRHFASKEELFVAAVRAAVTAVLEKFDTRVPVGRRLTVAQAAAVLAEELGPYAPMAVDLIGGALRHRPEHEEAGRVALGRLVSHVGTRVRGAGDDAGLGQAVVTRALSDAVAAALAAAPPST